MLTEDALLAGVRLRDGARLLKETGRSAHPTAMESLDAENFATVFQYDANGNRLSVRDGNKVAWDSIPSGGGVLLSFAEQCRRHLLRLIQTLFSTPDYDGGALRR